MPLRTFTPPRRPQFGTAVDRQPRYRAPRFGGGYVQRTPDGLNHNPENWRPVWNHLRFTEADEVDQFFKDHDDGTPFWWTPNGATTAIKVVCLSWQRVEATSVTDRISAVFEQDFSLDT